MRGWHPINKRAKTCTENQRQRIIWCRHHAVRFSLVFFLRTSGFPVSPRFIQNRQQTPSARENCPSRQQPTTSRLPPLPPLVEGGAELHACIDYILHTYIHTWRVKRPINCERPPLSPWWYKQDTRVVLHVSQLVLNSNKGPLSYNTTKYKHGHPLTRRRP